ncbi:MAG TPA: hypothetical protein VN681_00845, partial [Stellaceae bacterium]|nr:hypothetical protein [Stellaceae bacterium]
VEIGYKGFEWKDYGSLGAGWLKHRKHVYTLYFDTEEARHATYLGYIDPDNVEHVVCDFSAIDGEELRADDPASGPLCRDIAQHGFIPLDMSSADSAGDSRDIGRVWTRVDASIEVDFQNIRRNSPLVLLAFEGTAGRGCEFEYYDASRNGRPVEVGHAHDVLMALQNVNLGAVTPGPTCNRNFARWFEYHGQIYFDNHSTGDAATVPFHQVKRVKAGKIQQLCHSEFKITWQVKSIWPHL